MKTYYEFNTLLYKYKIMINAEKFVKLLIRNKGNKIFIDSNCFYHATTNNIDTLNSIYNRGILSKNLLNKIYIPECSTKFYNSSGYNGDNRVSVTKRNDIEIDSAYKTFIRRYPSFVLDDDINAIKTMYFKDNNYSIIDKIRALNITSCYQDEWQVFDKIEKEHILAIGRYIKDNIYNDGQLDIGTIFDTYEIIKWLDKDNIDLKFIDLSDDTEVNKELFLKYIVKEHL